MKAEEEEIEDLEELLDEPVRGKKRKTMSLYSGLGKDEFVTGSKDRKSRLDARQKQIAAVERTGMMMMRKKQKSRGLKERRCSYKVNYRRLNELQWQHITR